MDKQEFKEMPLKSKIGWLFQYYGGLALTIIVILAVLIYIIKSLLFPGDIADIVVIAYTDGITYEQFEDYRKEVEEKYNCSAEFTLYLETDAYGSQAFATRVGTDLVDLVIASEREMNIMSESNFLLSYAKIEGTPLYIGIPRGGREGELLESVITYLDDKLAGMPEND